jgi:hypothetical protein
METARKELMELVLRWENSARKQFECESRTADPVGKKVMAHGATVYFNCAQAIREVLNEPLLPPSTTQEEH